MSRITNAVAFFKEVGGEIRKIVWPTRSELLGACVVVVILAIFFALVLGGMDSAFSTAIKHIIG